MERAQEMWKKKGKKSNNNDRREKKHSYKTNRSDDTNIGNNKVLCWKHSETQGKNSQRGSHCEERNGTEPVARPAILF
jgi:hypothetical protein